MSLHATRLRRSSRRRAIVATAEDSHFAEMHPDGIECTACDYYGRVDGKTCPACHGIGVLPRAKTIGKDGDR